MNQKEELKKFYSAFPTIDSFKQAIDNRNFDANTRSVLTSVISGQYEKLKVPRQVSINIDRLKEQNTFTVTTGHQLNLLTGPLYFIYKIVTVINACKDLKEKYPAYDFVPVYWMASEDHDFEEINHFYFEGDKKEWLTEQTGAVGRFDPKEVQTLIDQLPEGASFFREAYNETTLANAARTYVNHLFGEEGLVVVDADDPKLKSLFSHVIEDDLFKHSALNASEGDSEEIRALGYKTQVNAREINFFYLEEAVRERIERTNDGFEVLNTDIKFSEEEIRQLIIDHPERFSPNVILRPLYQETILPNLAYVGGPSEAVYWLQLKSVFEQFETPFPLLMPRNFGLVISKDQDLKWKKTGLSYTDLFLRIDDALSKWVKEHSEADLSYEKEIAAIDQLYGEMTKKAKRVDQTLLQHIDALREKTSGAIRKAEKKLERAEKRKYQEKRAQIETVKEALFPKGSLQERRDNFLNFYLKDTSFVSKLLEDFDAFDYRMHLLIEE